MHVFINGTEYKFVPNAMQDAASRERYFDLVHSVFGLDFTPWYESGFSDDSFIPYTLFADNRAVASVGVSVNDFTWHDSPRRYVQISTVVTDPAYRKRGLSRWLTETVLNQWRENCDCIYLYANESVVEFYPKFGFVPAQEYTYSMPLTKRDGIFRKLDLSMRADVDLLIQKHRASNPFSLLAMDKDIGILMFHCVTFLRDYIYYIEKYDAVVIAAEEERELFCYDIYANNPHDISDLLGIIAATDTRTVTLGFTPKDATGYTIEQAEEGDTTFFVLEGKENILADHRVTFPFLSRA
ncbi:MAG: GNAT family N-acetyltransferase [Oscillospiraceae bacterium]|nr:GNAT family N-acetyltransferase [Oscillospiraceae bacterium]